MSISKRGGHTPIVNDAPLAGNTVSEQFHRFKTGHDTPAHDPAAPRPEAGTGAPGGDAPAGDAVNSKGGALTWDSLSELTPEPHVAGCSCAACLGMLEGGTDGGQKGGGTGFDPTAASPAGGVSGTLLTLGTNPDGSHYFSGVRNVDAILIGSMWSSTNLTYSFPTSGSNYNGTGFDSNGVSYYHVDLGTQQQAAARAAFAQLSAVSGLTFTEITETDTIHANIRISQSADNDVTSAYGGFPSDTRGVAGDIWFGRTSQPYYDMAYRGTWGFATMMHEIGHTMGLKHGHQDYTNSDLSFYFGTAPRYGSQSLTPDRDGQSWSLMTYTPAPFTNSNFAGEKINQPQTYMQYDLAALQYMYGANFNTNNTDSVYTFSQTTGEMFINGVGQGAPSGNKIYLTIWDGGGNDTIDASNYANGVTIDLRPGEFSTVDQNQLANNLAYQNLVNLAPGNFAMSLLYNNDARSLIENATGGIGNDIFVGNSANNLLDGGAGSDTVIFTGATGISITLNDTNTDIIVNHDGETDTLRSIENIQGTTGNDTLTGNMQDNLLSGGLGGTDILTGNDGNDRLIGGGYTTVNTTIITKLQTTANTSTGTAINPGALNAYTLVSDPYITNSTTVPHATINATAAGGGLEYYRLDVTAGTSGIFDIDFSGIDTWIEIVDSTGTTILANNDDSITDAGSSTGNSYLTFTFSTAGTYYIRVGRWTQAADTQAQPLAAGTTYTLNISLSSATVNTNPFTVNNTSSATLDGGEGNDVLLGTMGNDTIIGGNGNDTASFQTVFTNGTTGVTVDLNLQGAAQNTGLGGTDTLSGIENLIGSAYNDTLTGDGNDNVIEGGLGNDTLAGGGGTDTASYANATAGVTVNLTTLTAQNTVNAGTDTLSGFENLLGSAFADTLTGDANVNVITGGTGNDILNPGANAGGTVDTLDGGIGTDTASFAGLASGVTATLNGASDGSALIAGNAIAILRSIENLVGTAQADTLTGDANDNAIEGGLGNDTLDGGAGTNDTVVFTGSTALTINLATTTAQTTGFGSDTIINFENVRTGSGADNVTGDGNDNTFFDGGGNDTYNGAAGSDTIDYTNLTATTTVNLNTATAQTVSTSNSDTITNIENVTGSLTNQNNLTGGNTTNNRLIGGNVADFLIGAGLADTLFGGAGNDVIFGDYVNTFSTTAGQADGNDVIEGGAGSDQLVGGMGNDILRGGDGDDLLVSGLANGTISGLTTVYTNDGGQDIFEGGDGTDTAYAYYTDQTGAIVFDLRNLAGNSAITMGGVAAGYFDSIERVIFRGGTGNDDVHGTGYLDTLVGNAGNDVLDGWWGNDTLSGGLGDDTLIGGEGLDTATYVNATAGVNVDLRIVGVAQDTGGEGVDTLTGIEYLTGSGFGDNLRGDDDFNLIIDNAVAVTTAAFAQTDSLYGYGGNDSILVTRSGTTSASTAMAASVIFMDGGDGDDIIQLASGTVTTNTTDLAGLSAGAAYVNPGLSGTRFLDNVTVFGGNGNDRVVLTGVDAAIVDLGTGNDLLSISTLGTSGFNDHDIITGTGQDVIQFAGSSSTQATVIARNNVVHDFTVGDLGDRFELRTAGTSATNYATTSWVNTTNFQNLVNNTADMFDSGHFRLLQSGADLLFQVDRDGSGVATNGFITVAILQGAYTGGLTAFNFDGMIGSLNLTGIGAANETLTGASKADVLNGGDGNDALLGLAGNDTLNGGNGDDVMTGGAGNDALTGGGHSTYSYDTAVFSGNRSDYQINFISPGVVQVIDLRGGSPDGTDTLTGIERAVFADNDYYIDPATGALAANFAPIAIADVASATEDGAVVNGSVATNDADYDAGETATLTYALSAPVAGLSLAANGGYSFDPSDAAYQHLAAGVTQTVVANYIVTDVNGASTASTLTITVTGVNDVASITGTATGAAAEAGVTPGNTPFAGTPSVSGTLNVSDADDGQAVFVPVNAAGANGYGAFVVGSDGGWSYLLNNNAPSVQALAQGQVVTDTILVFSQDNSASQVITVTITGTNDAPVAAADIASGAEDGAVVFGSLAGNDSDVDAGATRTWALAAPVAGLALNSDGSYVFNPLHPAYQHLAQGATQTVTANYVVTDEFGATAVSTLTITVTGENDAPVAANDVNSATEDGTVLTGNVGANDSDVDDGATRTFALTGPAPAGLTFNPDGSYSFDPSNAAYQALALGTTQLVTATYTVTDDHGATATATLTITVTGANDAPDAVNDVATATEDGSVVTGSVATNDTDVDAGATRTFALAAPVAGLTLDPDGSYSFDPANAAYQHLAAGATQAVVATYVVTDDHGATDTATLTITVTGANDAPDAVDDTRSVTEDGGTITGNVGANDTDVDDGATRTYTLIDPAPPGFGLNPDGSYSFYPSNSFYQHLAAGATEVIAIGYVVTDDQGATDTGTLTITVTGANDAPDAVDDVATAIEDGPVVTGNVGANDTDVDDGATRTFALAAPVAGLTLDPDGSYSFDPANAAYQALGLGATQTVVATYVVTDDQGATDTATLTITVTGINDAPDAVNDVAAAIEDGAVVTGSVATNDTDADAGDTRSYALAAPVTGLTLNADGSYSFDPASYDSLAAGATATVVATYTVTDGQGATDTATLTITVTGIDDAGVARADAFTVTESGTITGASLFVDNGSGADSDVDGPLVIAAVNGQAGNVGTQITLASGALLTVNADGTFSYDPNGAFLGTPTANSGATNTPGHDSFTYTLAGGNTATVNITLTGLDTDDVLIGSAGADLLAGGLGNDTYYVQNTADLVLEAVGAGSDSVYTTVSYALAAGAEVEWLSTANNASTATIALVGNEFAQVLVGNAGYNYLSGGGGADVMIGLGGNDTYFVDNVGDLPVEAAGGGFDAVYAETSYALAEGSEIEWLSTISNSATTAINLTGNALGQYLIGNEGANVLDGRGGADFMQGLGGNDTYYVDNGSDAPVEAAGGGFDTVYTSISFGLATGTEIEWLSAIDNNATTAINLLGNEIANTLVGNNGANALDGAAGADTMIGYGGNDTYVVDNAGDSVIEAAGGGFDAIYTTSSFTLGAGQEVEWLSAATVGSTTALNLTGNELGNYVLGNNGANVINGGAGADFLYGYGGADTFAFTTALGAGNADWISDFVSGTDKIALDDAIFTAIGSLGALNANAFVTGTAAGDADDRIIYNSATGQLFYDADGNGAGAAVLFATLNGNPVLTASDFQVI